MHGHDDDCCIGESGEKELRQTVSGLGASSPVQEMKPAARGIQYPVPGTLPDHAIFQFTSFSYCPDQNLDLTGFISQENSRMSSRRSRWLAVTHKRRRVVIDQSPPRYRRSVLRENL